MEKIIVRSCRNIKAGSNIVSLSCPKSLMAIADAKGLYNTSTNEDGTESTHRPDVTIFVPDSVAASINEARANGKTLALEVKEDLSAAKIELSTKGRYYIKGEHVLANAKHLKFSVTTPIVAEFDDMEVSDAPF